MAAFASAAGARRSGRRKGGLAAALLLLAVLGMGLLHLGKLQTSWLSSPAAVPSSSAQLSRKNKSKVQHKKEQAWTQLSLEDSSADSAELEPGSDAAGGSALPSLPSPPPPPSPKPRLKVTQSMRKRCEGTLGSWCLDYLSQVPVPAVTAPMGNRTCSLDCNKVGTCNALTGLCTCRAGWQGFNCLLPMKRFCTHRYHSFGMDVPKFPPNETAGTEAESIWAFARSHCSGYCDEDVAACYCPSNTPYGRKPAPADARLDAPPFRQGRPLGLWCQPNTTSDGRPTTWGTVDPQRLWGPEGWCNAAEPKQYCECFMDGWGGPTCEDRYEMFCLNQCNGRGECISGYCKCDPGWHGIDCAHHTAKADLAAPGREVDRPWIAEHIHIPASQEFPPSAKRKRPLIYVYELPSEYSVLMLQYRHGGENCVPRLFVPGNMSRLSPWPYALETGLLEMILQSEHRTLNPEEADYFYVPVLPSCFMYPVRDFAGSLRDFYYGWRHNRAHGSANMLLETYHWLRAHLPYWDRRGGKDHIWLVTHDEASCYVPAAIRSSIIFSHWGRMDKEHTSNTGYWGDFYSEEVVHPQWEPDGFQRKIVGHPCYDPVKDLIVPLMKTPDHFHLSPLIGGPTRNRTWLAFHRGRVQMENKEYSRGIRQRMAAAAKEGKWLEKYRIAVGEHEDIYGDYSELMASSVFCLVLPGDGWSARMDDATLHGCIPVIVMDNVHVSFESVVDLSAFTLRIPQADAEKLPEILQAVSQERREEMQRNLGRVWQRFTYSSYRPYAKRFKEIQSLHKQAQQQQQQQQQPQGGDGGSGSKVPPPQSLPATVPDLDPTAGDAFTTIIAWLYSRIDATR